MTGDMLDELTAPENVVNKPEIVRPTMTKLRTPMMKSRSNSPVSHLRITKKQAINVGDHDLLYIEGFCEHSDIENDLLPKADIAGGSNVIESDTGDWYFFVEGLQEWQKRLTIGEEE